MSNVIDITERLSMRKAWERSVALSKLWGHEPMGEKEFMAYIKKVEAYLEKQNVKTK